MKKYILGVKIDDVNMEQALEMVEKWIWNPGKHYIVTPNPEMIVAAQGEKLFREILNGADLSIPDGNGLKLSGKVKNAFAGTDFMENLIALAAEKGFVTGFLGGRDEVASKTAECLLRKYPNLKISLANSGGEIDNQGRQKEEDLRLMNNDLRNQDHKSLIINHKSLLPTDILFVAFGPPKQEKWIAKNLPHVPVKLAMGVGGAFDYFSGKVPRAPKWIRKFGLEWFFRLIVQPWRIKRQFSLVKFIFYILRNVS